MGSPCKTLLHKFSAMHFSKNYLVRGAFPLLFRVLETKASTWLLSKLTFTGITTGKLTPEMFLSRQFIVKPSHIQMARRNMCRLTIMICIPTCLLILVLVLA